MGIKDWFKAKQEKKKQEEEWKAQIKEEALAEAREEIKAELKKKYIEEEKDRLKSGKSKFLSTLEKEFGGVSDRMKSNIGESTNKPSGSGMGKLDFSDKLEREFGGKRDNIFKSGDEISGLMGVKKSDDVINSAKVDKMLGNSIDTNNPQDKIGKLDFKSGIQRSIPKFKK